MDEHTQSDEEGGAHVPQDPAGGELQVTRTGRGSFCIPPDAVAALLANKASAVDIAAYLVLARFTGHDGRFSTAGVKAIKKAVGLGDAMAEAAIERLLKNYRSGRSACPILYRPDEWALAKQEAVPAAATVKSQVRWVLNDFAAKPTDGVWFGNALVDGIGRFARPLLRLKRCGDVAARLLLKLHQANDMTEYGGIPPHGNVFKKYNMTQAGAFAEYKVWHGQDGNLEAYNFLSNLCQGHDSSQRGKPKPEEIMEHFWTALNALESCGFIYESVTVLDGDPGKPDSLPICSLKTKSRHGDPPKGEEGLGGETARLAGLLGYPVTDKAGRFYGKYAAIVPAYITQPHIAGIYRLRFRVANPRNYGVTEAWARFHSRQREADEWLAEVKRGLDFQRPKP